MSTWILPLLLALATSEAAEKKTLLVFTSSDSAHQSEILNTFKGQTEYAVRMSYNLGITDVPGAFIEENLSELEPALVLAIGDVALKAAANHYKTVPLLYADVRADVARSIGRRDLVGIAKRPNPDAAIQGLTELMPQMVALGVIRGRADEDPYWSAIQKACEGASIEYVEERVDGVENVPDAQRRLMHSTDAILVVDDSQLWTSASLARVFADANRAHHPLISYARAHMQAAHPPALALTTGAKDVADEAARITKAIIVDGQTVDEFAGGYPVPQLVGHREALLDARVVLTKKRAAAVQSWADEAEEVEK